MARTSAYCRYGPESPSSESDFSKSKIKFGGESPRDFRFYFDISKAKKVLKFKPTPLDKGLKEYIKYLEGGGQ